MVFKNKFKLVIALLIVLAYSVYAKEDSDQVIQTDLYNDDQSGSETWLRSSGPFMIGLFYITGAFYFMKFAITSLRWFNFYCAFVNGLQFTYYIAMILGSLIKMRPNLWLFTGMGVGAIYAIPSYFSIYYGFMSWGYMAGISPVLFIIHIFAIFFPDYNFVGYEPTCILPVLCVFGIVGIVNGMLMVKVSRIIRPYVFSQIIANNLAIGWNFILINIAVKNNSHSKIFLSVIAIIYIMTWVFGYIGSRRLMIQVYYLKDNQYSQDQKYYSINKQPMMGHQSYSSTDSISTHQSNPNCLILEPPSLVMGERSLNEHLIAGNPELDTINHRENFKKKQQKCSFDDIQMRTSFDGDKVFQK